MAGVEGVIHVCAPMCTLPTELKIARGIGEGSTMMGVSCSRAGEVGKVPPFCFQARFPRHGGAEESKIK